MGANSVKGAADNRDPPELAKETASDRLILAQRVKVLVENRKQKFTNEFKKAKVSTVTVSNPDDLARVLSTQADADTETYNCNECRSHIVPGRDEHWRCWEGCDYDLCAKCHKKIKHPHTLVKEDLGNTVKKELTKGASVGETLCNALALFADRACLGERLVTGSTPDGKVTLGDYQWLTYSQVYTRSRVFGSGLLQYLSPRDIVGISGRNKTEWFLADIACAMYNLTIVPLHVYLDEERIAYIINQCSIKLFICTKEILPKVLKVLPQCPSLRVIVQMEDEPLLQAPANSSVKLMTFLQLAIAGLAAPREMVPAQPEDLFTIMWTSGSTGLPKGVMLTNESWNTDMKGRFNYPIDLIQLSYAPLAHTTDRKTSLICIVNGGRFGIFSRGEMSELFNELQFIRPTVLTAPPRIWNEAHELYLQWLREAGNNPAAEPDLLKRCRQLFGGRLVKVITGGAPTSPAVKEWMRKCFNVDVTEGYGVTEFGSIATNGYINSSIDLKLEDVPELGYFKTDEPFPRGEICVRKKGLDKFKGYFNDERRTKEAFTEDGYYRTGDIGEMQPGRIRVIDRKSNVVKLAQSEFVATEHLETLYSECPAVSQIFVAADSLQSYVVAIVVPSDPVLRAWAEAHKLSTSREELCRNRDFRAYVLKELADLGLKQKRRFFEIPRNIFLESVSFSVENRKLTANFKISRPFLNKAYKDVIAQLYREFNQRDQSQSASFGSVVSNLFGEDAKQRLLTAGQAQQGGRIDSMDAVRLMNTLQSQMGITVPLQAIFSRPLHEIGQMVDAAATNPETFGAALQRADEVKWDQEMELPANVIAPREPQPPGDGILLTGCTGFLGAFLLVELLEQCDKPIFCLVRPSKTQQDVLSRLRKSLEDYLLWDRAKLFEARIKIVKGDVEQLRFGLTPDEYDRLSAAVGTVIHNAAVVNAILPYAVMKKSNVTGTINTLLLCVNKSIKRMEYVSSVSVLRGKPGTEWDEEDAPPTVHLDRLGGYAQSKLVAEYLAREARKRGVPVNIYRPSSISGDTRTGAANTADFVERLLCGCAMMQAAPDLPMAGYNLVPVDYVSKNLVHVALSPSQNRCYHLVDPAGLTQVSDLVASLRAFGYNIKQLPYEEWHHALQSVPPAHPLYMLRTNFSMHGLGGAGCYLCTKSRPAYLPAVRCPHNDAAHLHLQLRFLIARGLLTPPQQP